MNALASLEDDLNELCKKHGIDLMTAVIMQRVGLKWRMGVAITDQLNTDPAKIELLKSKVMRAQAEWSREVGLVI